VPNVAERFGTLLKRYITMRGWTYEQTGFEVWGTDGRKAHVSGYVGGSRGKPSSPTIAKFRDALEIPQAEIDACFETAAAPSMPEGAGLPEALLENLAVRFGHDNPDAGPDALTQFLKDKAKEHEGLQTRFAELAETENRWANQLGIAKSLIDEGQFDEADMILADAEEFQQTEHTLVEVRKQANLRATRGEAALLKGDPDTAYTHYAAAADMVQPFELIEAAVYRRAYSVLLLKHSQRFGGNGLRLAADLLTDNLTDAIRNSRESEWSDSQITLGIALRGQGTRTQGEAGAALFAKAVAAYEAALTVRTQEDHPVQWAMTQNNLGIALKEQGSRTQGDSGAALFAQSVAAYEAALTVRTQADHPLDWAMTQNNLGNALQEQGKRTEGEAGAALFAQAVTAYEAALVVLTQAGHPVQWATTQNNLGNALSEQGERTQGEAGAALFAQAVAAYEAALTIRTQADHPMQWAMTQNNLGGAMQEQGKRTEGEAGAALFAQAVTAYEAALTVHTPADHPMQWAMTQMNIGMAYTAMAEREEGDTRTPLDRALAALDNALTIFDPEHTGYYFDGCTAAREKAAALRAALDD